MLVWYFSTLSQVNVVYGSFATTIVVLLSLEIAALVLLLGAQVIAEYERTVRALGGGAARALHTDNPRSSSLLPIRRRVRHDWREPVTKRPHHRR